MIENIKSTIETLKAFPIDDPVMETAFTLSELEEIAGWHDKLEQIKTYCKAKMTSNDPAYVILCGVDAIVGEI